jgi:hypothetical protein
MARAKFDALEYLKAHQGRMIPGPHDKPFQESPPQFQSINDPDEVVRAHETPPFDHQAIGEKRSSGPNRLAWHRLLFS